MRDAARVLGTRLWWRHAFLRSGDAIHKDFIERFGIYASYRTGYGLDPRSLQAWEKGRKSVSEGIVHRVESRIHGTKFVYATAALLTQKRLSAPNARRTLANHVVRAPDGTLNWQFPSINAADDAGRPCVTYRWNDSEQLASRRDFLGMLAILVLLREAMAQSAFDSFEHHAQHLYLVLPDVLRLKWVRPDTDLLLQCIEQAISRFQFGPLCPLINWSAFRSRILEPSLEPREYLSPPGVAAYVSDAGTSEIFERPVPLLPGVAPLQPHVIRKSTMTLPGVKRDPYRTAGRRFVADLEALLRS